MPLSTKMKAVFGVLIVAVIAAIVAVSVSAASTGAPVQPMKLVCVITSGPGGRSALSGSVVFTQSDDASPVMLNGSLRGFAPGDVRAFHVHEFGDFSDEKNPCMSTGGHFNPWKLDHGDREAPVRHVGDLGNLKADDQGVISIEFEDKLLSLYAGPRNIAGRACVVHGGQDDLGQGGNAASKANGNAGPRIGCGIVGIAKV